MSDFWKDLTESGSAEALNLTAIDDQSPGFEEIISMQPMLTSQKESVVENCVFRSNDNETDVENLKKDNQLHEAVVSGNFKLLEKILYDSNISKLINDFDNNGKTPLYIAAEKGDQACISILIENGADLNKKSLQRGTPAYVAALNNYSNCLLELIKNNATISGPKSVFEIDQQGIRVHNAVVLGQVEQLNELLKDCENISDLINQWDMSGKTLLHLAVEKNSPQCLQVLIDHGANINEINIGGGTALFVAACKSRKNCLYVLLENKADMSQVDIHKQTPLYMAAINNDQNCLNLLIDSGADINEAALLAASQGERECLKLLIGKGADLSYSKDNRETIVDYLFTNIREPSEFLTDVFNARVYTRTEKNKKIYILDFDILTPKGKRQMHVFSSLLKSINSEEETSLLNHIFCKIYVDIKMQTITARAMISLNTMIWYLYFFCIFFYVSNLPNVLHNESTSGNLVYLMTAFVPIRLIFGYTQVRRLYLSKSFLGYSLWAVMRSCLHFVSPALLVVLLIGEIIVTKGDNSSLHWFVFLTGIVLVVHFIEYISIHLKFTLIGNYYIMFLTVLYRTVLVIHEFLQK